MACIYQVQYFLDPFLKTKKNDNSKQIFTALFTQFLSEYMLEDFFL